MNLFWSVNNKALTLNIAVNYVKHFLRQSLQRLITDRVFRDVAFDAVQKCCIKQAVSILSGIDIKIGTNKYSSTPPILMLPKVTHIIK